MIDWIPLFEEAGIPWRNQGKNTSKRNVNICCPFCGDDVGYHLACSVAKDVYYCYREPTHNGGNIPKMLVACGLDWTTAKALLDSHSDGQGYTRVEEKKETTPQTQRWERFEPITATEGRACLRYMQRRGFPNALEVASRYDLRYAELGSWAKRLILPVTENGEVVSWTARALWAEPNLKYKADKTMHAGLVYAPRLPRDKALIVEGPLDALKIDAAQGDWAALALMGKGLNPQKIMRLLKLLVHTQRVYFVPDKDVTYKRYDMADQLMQAAPGRLKIVDVPDEYKDAGEMEYHAVRNWLRGLEA